MKQEKNLRIRRAILHILTGTIILFLTIYYKDTRWLLFYALILGIILSFLSFIVKIPLIGFFLENFELKRHRKEFPGKSLLFFVAGSLLVIKLFPQNIALASIAILTFADPASYFFSRIGKKYRNPVNKNKTLASFLISIIIAFIAANFFIEAKYAILSSIFSMLAESFNIKIWEDHIDDNFLIPLVAGTIIYIAKMFF